MPSPQYCGVPVDELPSPVVVVVVEPDADAPPEPPASPVLVEEAAGSDISMPVEELPDVIGFTAKPDPRASSVPQLTRVAAARKAR